MLSVAKFAQGGPFLAASKSCGANPVVVHHRQPLSDESRISNWLKTSSETRKGPMGGMACLEAACCPRRQQNCRQREPHPSTLCMSNNGEGRDLR